MQTLYTYPDYSERGIRERCWINQDLPALAIPSNTLNYNSIDLNWSC